MRLCTKCGVEKPVEAFSKNSRGPGGLHYHCKTCMNEAARQNYQNNKERYYRNTKTRNEWLTKKLDDLKRVPCADCGGAFDPVCMDFDHLPGNVKVANISWLRRHRVAWLKIEEEIKKCEVVCANCHRLRTKNRLVGAF